ncbi:MAG: hypothetical protein ABS25_00475 [Cryomorphaceae bacterium BACL18 MAG-120507-bin74]|jgi:hypothetical protein|nr:MAG: hypothetical protein ABS25_00475 [Cryomorphaceae bacterium BACL18 MAG-120507-bin74]HAG34344.1 hypothetical protein [Cryomorphaceae bacterium]
MKSSMRNLGLILVAFAFTQCANQTLSESEVKDFVTTHFEEKVGYSDAVTPFLEDIGTDLTVLNTLWGESSVFPVEDVAADWFYEDSVSVEIFDLYIHGGTAVVMGSDTYWIDGEATSKSRFCGTVIKENGKLVWKRYAFASENERARDFVWPSVEGDGALDSYNTMRTAMVNLRNSDGLRISDSLVEAYPDWATAHLGQLHYYILAGDETNLRAKLAEAQSKESGCTPAEKTLISAYNPDLTREERRGILAKALGFAGDDPMIRFWYTWTLDDLEEKMAVLEAGLLRFPESSVLNNMIAYVHMDAGELDEAAHHLNVYMRIHPEEPNAYDSMGDLLAKQGDVEGAKKMYLKASSMHPDFAEVSKRKSDEL